MCTYIHIHISIKPGQCGDMADAKRRINNEMYCWLLFWARRFRELISGLWFLLASPGFSAMTHSNRKTDEIALAVTGMRSLYDLQWDSRTSESDMIRAEQQPKRWSLFVVKWYFTLLSPPCTPNQRMIQHTAPVQMTETPKGARSREAQPLTARTGIQAFLFLYFMEQLEESWKFD